MLKTLRLESIMNIILYILYRAKTHSWKIEKIFLSGDLGTQYVLISKRAFSNLHFLDFEETHEISREQYYLRKVKADGIYAELVKNDRYIKGIRLRDLVFENE